MFGQLTKKSLEAECEYNKIKNRVGKIARLKDPIKSNI